MDSRKPARSPLLQRLLYHLASSRFLTTSLLVHVFMISALGGIVLFKTAQNQDAFMAVGNQSGILQSDEVATPTDEAPEEFEEPAEIAESSPPSAASAASAISSLTEVSSNWTTTASMDQMTIGNSLRGTGTLSTGLAGGSGGQGRGGAGGPSKMSGRLFGVEVQTNKLGVVLDVSSSALGYLISVFSEIEAQFSGAEMVLNIGCGMSPDAKARDYVVKPAKHWSKYEGADPNERPTVFQPIVRWIELNPQNATLIKRFLQQKNVSMTASDRGIPPTMGTLFAFEYLIEQKVDTIYWFADFADPIDPEVAQSLAKRLKEKNIKLIAQNLSGRRPNDLATMIVNETGGLIIRETPKKK